MLGIDINLITPTAALSLLATFGALLVAQGLASAFAGAGRIDGTGPNRSHSLGLRDGGNLACIAKHVGRNDVRQWNGRNFHSNLASFDQNIVNFTRILQERHEQIVNRSLLGSSIMSKNAQNYILHAGSL